MCGGLSFSFQMALDDKTLWRSSYVKKWVAGHQSNGWACCAFQDRGCFRGDDFNSGDAEFFGSFSRLQQDLVAPGNASEFAEEAVSMTGDSNISVLSRRRGPCDPAGSAVQSFLARVAENRNLQVNLWNSK